MKGVNAASRLGGSDENIWNDVLDNPPSWLLQRNAFAAVPTESAGTGISHHARERLLQFQNNITGTAGYVRPGQPSDREELEEMIFRARVSKQELWANRGIKFEKEGGFLDDMRRYVRTSLEDANTLPYVTVVTEDREHPVQGEMLAGFTWVEPTRLPHDAHISRRIAPQYAYLDPAVSNGQGGPQVRSIGAVVVNDDFRRRGIADVTYLAMLNDMQMLGVSELTFEIYHLLTTVRMELNDILAKQAESIDIPTIINQANIPSMKMHEDMGARHIGWVIGRGRVISEEDRDVLTQFLSKLYIMDVDMAVSILEKKLRDRIVLPEKERPEGSL